MWSQMDRFTGTCLRVQPSHRLGDWPRRESLQETHLHFSHSPGKVEQKFQTLSLITLVITSLITLLFATDFCKNLSTVSKFPHIFLFPVSVPPVATTMTQVWLSLSTTHQNLPPRHGRAADFHLQSYILSAELMVGTSRCWWQGRGKDKIDH